MPDRHVRRRQALSKSLRKHGIDAILVTSEPNVSYLTGFTGDSSALLLDKDRAVVLSDGRYTEQLEQECPDLPVEARDASQLPQDFLAKVLSKHPGRKIGYEVDNLSVATFDCLREGASTVQFKPVSGEVEALRAIKDRDELAAIREAIDQAQRAFVRVTSALRSSQSEKDLADEIEDSLRRCGASGSSFPPIVAVGKNAARPHHSPQASTRLGDADFILIDWGANGRGYKSDLTRVLITGKVTSKFETVYRAVLAAQERAIATIRPGVTGGAVDAAARSALEEQGLNRFFDHGLGHGIGLQIHEAPRLRKDAKTLLRPGMVITIEPGVYIPGWGGVRIEDDILVTPEGCEVLTHVPKALESIRYPISP